MMGLLIEEILIYGIVAIICLIVVWIYLRKNKSSSSLTQQKVDIAKAEGRFEPVSLYPHIDLNTCIGSGACIKACPEQDILGIVDDKATAINASACIGHGACFHACPVEAITLRIGTATRGVDLPHVKPTYETNVSGIYIAGELGGMGLIKNSIEQGKQAVENIAKSTKKKIEGIPDLVIIGAGPAGIGGALTAKKNGLDVVVLDQDSLGGTVSNFPRTKIVMTRPVDLPLYGKVKFNETSKSELLKVWNEALSNNEIKIEEHVKVDKITPLVDNSLKVISNDGREWQTNHVLLAIGRRGSPRKLGIPGEESEKVAYKLLEPERISGKKIMVVGGGDSAVESAMLLMEENEVTLSYRKEKFARIKPKNQERINEAIEKGYVKPLFNSNLISIEPDKIQLQVNAENGEAVSIENDLVYIFIGGELPTKFLENAGVTITKRFGQIMKKH